MWWGWKFDMFTVYQMRLLIGISCVWYSFWCKLIDIHEHRNREDAVVSGAHSPVYFEPKNPAGEVSGGSAKHFKCLLSWMSSTPRRVWTENCCHPMLLVQPLGRESFSSLNEYTPRNSNMDILIPKSLRWINMMVLDMYLLSNMANYFGYLSQIYLNFCGSIYSIDFRREMLAQVLKLRSNAHAIAGKLPIGFYSASFLSKIQGEIAWPVNFTTSVNSSLFIHSYYTFYFCFFASRFVLQHLHLRPKSFFSPSPRQSQS